ncbi:2,4-dienoyl-CoA reductase [Hyaloraphidium curvatum]|nr:2,4-dienoyl-CoA reductase [Hyaloraphidium curvatum]
MSGGLKVVPSTTSIFQPDILKGKVAFVTGGGSGICKGMAEAMLRHGAKATIFSRTQERLDRAAEQMRKDIPGAEVLAISGDVRNPEDLEKAVKATVERFGKIDIVVAGAAGNFLAPIEQLSYRAFKTVVDIDLLGTFNTIKACFPHLKASGNASIIGVTATLHYHGTPWQVHPVAAKAGVDAMFKTMAVEWGPYGIRTNIIAPGPIGGTEGMDRLSLAETRESRPTRIPLRTIGAIGDIEQATLYLASDASRFTTGATLVVDGGSWLTQDNFRPTPEELEKAGRAIPRVRGPGKL